MNCAGFSFMAALCVLGCQSAQVTSVAADVEARDASSASAELRNEEALMAASHDAGGLTRADLVQTVMKERSKAFICFRDSPDCAARATIQIAPSGGVVDVKVGRISGGPLRQDVATCLETVIRKWRFPDAGTTTSFSHFWECKKD